MASATISTDGQPKDAHNHTWNSGMVTRKATPTTVGIKTYTCTICGQTKTENIPKLPGEKITISKKPTILKPSAGKNTITVKWSHFKHSTSKTKKIWNNIKRIQVQCATDKKFKNKEG